MKKVVFFDLWNTLAYIKSGDPKLKIKRKFMLNKKEVNQLNNLLCLSKSIDKIAIKICKVLGITPSKENLEFLIKTLKTPAKYEIYKDANQIVDYLRKKYKLAIISNIYPTTARFIRRIPKFKKFLEKFDKIIFSCEVGSIKPKCKNISNCNERAQN
jgi:FMN phosphatase YigB (HAD superfamily)